MNILVIDIGGTDVKVWAAGERRPSRFSSGKWLTPLHLLERLKSHLAWRFDRVSLGYPGEVRNGQPAAEPANLGPGWVDFDWSNAFDCPLRIMNDACMQALGSYAGGRMLYLGLGTGIGTAFIFDGQIIPLALGHLLFQEKDFGHYLGRNGLDRYQKKEWRDAVLKAGVELKAAFLADYVVFGGGNARQIGALPAWFRKGGNRNAYFGGWKM